MNLVLMGLPGAGKGTQAERIFETYAIPHISTGDMFRAAIRNKTQLGIQAKAVMDEGNLVPDEITNGIVEERLTEADTAKGFLLDGFPRTLAQAEALDDILSKLNKKIDAVINIHVDESLLIERLAGRFMCKNCGATYHKINHPPQVEGTCDRCGEHEFYQREDDKPETVKNRLSVNLKSSAPILKFYENHQVLYTIDGNRDIEDVFKEVQQIITNL